MTIASNPTPVFDKPMALTPSRRSAVLEWVMRYNFVFIFLFAVTVATFLSDDFLTFGNIANLFQQGAIVGIVAIGMTFVILTANIDLSVGSLCAFGGILVAVLLQQQVSGWLAVPATLLVGLAIGTLMGSLTVFGKVPSFIITLAGLVSLRGATFLASDGAPIGGLPASFTGFGSSMIDILPSAGIAFPVLGLIFILITLIAWLVLRAVYLWCYLNDRATLRSSVWALALLVNVALLFAPFYG